MRMRYWCYDLTKLSCWVVFRGGFGLEVRGKEHVPRRGPFIVASNHCSFLDPPVVGTACPRRLTFLARADLFQRPLLGAFLRGVHAVPLRRGEGDRAALSMAKQLLASGQPVAIFPEGTRQLSGILGEARRGVGLLAETTGVPVIPAFVSGTFQALPPHAQRLYPAKIRVAFGPAVAYTKSSGVRGVSSGRAPELVSDPLSPRSRHERIAQAVTAAWRQLAEDLHAHN